MGSKLDTGPAVPESRKLGAGKMAVLIVTPVVLMAAAWGGSYLMYQKLRTPAVDLFAASAQHPPDGDRLFAQHCAACHGARGDGNGVTSLLLDPPARRFGEERFRLVSTVNGAPTDDDLLAVIRSGVPTSAMPSFAHLPEEEQRAIIGHVRGLTREALFARIFRKAEQEGGADPTEVAEAVEAMLRPGPRVEVPQHFAAATPESIAHGRQIYVQNCASCHGPEGRGDGPQVKDLKTETGWPTRPRDLSRGVFKGGSDPGRLYTRIVLGMPGTPMPASSTLQPEQVTEVIHYILSLSRPQLVARGGVD